MHRFMIIAFKSAPFVAVRIHVNCSSYLVIVIVRMRKARITVLFTNLAPPAFHNTSIDRVVDNAAVLRFIMRLHMNSSRCKTRVSP